MTLLSGSETKTIDPAASIAAASIAAASIARRQAARAWSAAPCVICATALEVADGAERPQLGRCPGCGHHQLHVAPEPEDVVAIFGTPYWGTDEAHRVDDATSRAEREVATGRLRLDRDVFPFGTTRVLLDLRAGTGGLVAAARERGAVADGGEAVAALRAIARRTHGVELRASDQEIVDLGAGSRNAVVAYGLLDHVVEPSTILSRARWLLVRGGHLVVECRTTPPPGSSPSETAQRLDASRVAHLYTGADLVTVVERHRFKAIDLHCPSDDTVVVIAEAVA